jgi:hypothetical protein
MKTSWLAFLIVLAGCKIDQTRPIEKERLGFAVADDAELFFKNVRQIYYDVQTLPQANVTVYRHPDRYASEDRAALWPALVLSTEADEAKILIENNSILDAEPALQVRIKSQNVVTEVVLDTRGREQMLAFATTIYQNIQQQAEFELMANGQWHPWLTHGEEREAFRITMADFYRLTGTL